MGHSPWGLKESGTFEVTEHARRQLKQKGLTWWATVHGVSKSRALLKGLSMRAGS